MAKSVVGNDENGSPKKKREKRSWIDYDPFEGVKYIVRFITAEGLRPREDQEKMVQILRTALEGMKL